MNARSLKRAMCPASGRGFDRGEIDGSLVADEERGSRGGERRQVSRTGMISEVDGVPEPDGEPAVRAVEGRSLVVIIEPQGRQALEEKRRVSGNGFPETPEEPGVGGEDRGELRPDVPGAVLQPIEALSVVIPSDERGTDERRQETEQGQADPPRKRPSGLPSSQALRLDLDDLPSGPGEGRPDAGAPGLGRTWKKILKR